MLHVDTKTIRGVANTVTLSNGQLKKACFAKIATTYKDTNIQSLRNPVRGDAIRHACRQAIDVASGCAAVVIDVAGQASRVVGVTKQEDALDGVELRPGEL